MAPPIEGSIICECAHLCGQRERDMAGDTEWVDEVRRWVLAGQPRAAARDGSESALGNGAEDCEVIGYEAADPALQSLTFADTGGATLTLR